MSIGDILNDLVQDFVRKVKQMTLLFRSFGGCFLSTGVARLIDEPASRLIVEVAQVLHDGQCLWFLVILYLLR